MILYINYLVLIVNHLLKNKYCIFREINSLFPPSLIVTWEPTTIYFLTKK